MEISVFINVLVHYVMDIARMNILVTVMITQVDHSFANIYTFYLSESFSRIEKPMIQNLHDEKTQLEINIHKTISFSDTPNLVSSPRQPKLKKQIPFGSLEETPTKRRRLDS